MRILIAEDEVGLARGLKFLLEKNNYTVDIVQTGLDALYYFRNNQYDTVILDIMMPGMDGLEVLTTIRRLGSSVPIMLLTAKAEIVDRVKGLEKGADDYLPKPFATQEFVARVKALLRRNAEYSDFLVNYGDACLDCNRFELCCGTHKVRLNNKEFQLAELFFRHPRYVFSTNHLMDKVWGQESSAGTEVIWTYIGFLRKKMRTIGSTVEIRTIRGAGYSLEDSRW